MYLFPLELIIYEAVSTRKVKALPNFIKFDVALDEALRWDKRYFTF